MNKIDAMVEKLKNIQTSGYWKDRIVAELEYVARISRVKNGIYRDEILSAVKYLNSEYNKNLVISKENVMNTEDMLKNIKQDAKSYTMICTAHAHIDMNWMWRWDETVAITLDTFRTMLNLMNEYPDFHFSQSQASVYKIVEEYCPEMLEEIKNRVKEGRWEVTASTWVEGDKNMPNGESMARHLLYTKNYLCALLDIGPEKLNIDFEPDTFGHNVNVPEILNNGGVKYYYHCRGYCGHNVYKWVSPSGGSVIVYREPDWYNAAIKPGMVAIVPEFCQKYGISTMLKVYGVGDHGGGPTRRDIERIQDMRTWPIYPELKFGTFAEFYQTLESKKDELPVVDSELNFIFTGCYTTQSRIKMSNRISEATLNEAESFSSVAALSIGLKYSAEQFAKAWENVLFNQFHDIIPGSGIADTREYALGLFQKTMAIAGTRKTMAMRGIAARIDTSAFAISEDDLAQTVSEGAGVGYGLKNYRISQYEMGKGINRIFHIFNSSAYERKEAAEITIWDWNGDLKRLTFRDSTGNVLDHQLLDQGYNQYWDHSYMRILVKIIVPALGYCTITMSEDQDKYVALPLERNPRVELADEFVLENDYVKAIFNNVDASLTSFVEKKTGKEFVDKGRKSGVFRLINEDDSKGMTSWTVGNYTNIENITNIKISKISTDISSIRQTLAFEAKFAQSKLNVKVSLDYNSSSLCYNVDCEWLEVGRKGKGIPQLGFFVALPFSCQCYKYDIPFGTIKRTPRNMDVPANSWAAAQIKASNSGEGDKEIKESKGKALTLVTDTKYGFRCVDDSMSITLIRSAFDPDPYPELGAHKFKFSLGLAENNNLALIENAYIFNHELNVITGTVHEGDLALKMSFVEILKGSISVSAVKMPEMVQTAQERYNKIILRVYETEGVSELAEISLFSNVKNAYFIDFNENSIQTASEIKLSDNKISFMAVANSILSIAVEF